MAVRSFPHCGVSERLVLVDLIPKLAVRKVACRKGATNYLGDWDVRVNLGENIGERTPFDSSSPSHVSVYEKEPA